MSLSEDLILFLAQKLEIKGAEQAAPTAMMNATAASAEALRS